MKRYPHLSIFLLLLGIGFFLVNKFSFTTSTIADAQIPKDTGKILRPIFSHFFRPACGISVGNRTHCFAKITTQNDGTTPLTGTVPLAGSMGPVQFHTAYQLPCQPGGVVSSACTPPSSFGPQMIAIVDAFNSPNIESDLNTYSSYFGIPSCTKANGCLTVVDQNGGNNLPTTIDSGWTLEASLDTQIAHTICQTCRILLVETASNSFSSLATGVATAANLGATAISNSYGGGESFGETSYDSYYHHPGIAVTASAGDSGYGAEYPAASPYVVSVGGTTLQLFTDNTYASESVWSSTGSGCSRYETANSWQTNLSNWSLTGCASKRAIADVSADADPNTGAAVFDSTPYNGLTGWWEVGGTSLSSPLIAAVFAESNGLISGVEASSLLYRNYSLSNFHDIRTGSNGMCSGRSICTAVVGYDGPTGLGSPFGIGGFSALSTTVTPTPTSTISPTATPTPTPTKTPTPTPTPTCRRWYCRFGR